MPLNLAPFHLDYHRYKAQHKHIQKHGPSSGSIALALSAVEVNIYFFATY